MLIKIVGAIVLIFVIFIMTYGSYKNSMVFSGIDPKIRGYPYTQYNEGFTSSKNNKNGTSFGTTFSPASLYNQQPYHLLNDYLESPQSNVSSVTNQACYGMDFEASIAKTGNFRQLTNNYKREFPDSCSAPFKELVMNFYKIKGF